MASVFLNIVQNQRAQQDHKLLQGEITDLRYQVNEDKNAAGGASPSPSPSASPSPSVSPSPSDSPAASPTPTPADDSSKTATIKTRGNVHQGPSTSSKVLIPYTQLTVGTVVTLGTAASGGYQQITVNGVTGYILASYLQ